jgi:NADH-quinone oxidoreductase subunit H
MSEIIPVTIKVICIFAALIVWTALLPWVERRMLGLMQDRYGPNRVGPQGILQPMADGIKLFFKEEVIPAGADRTMFILAPVFILVTALIAFAVIPTPYIIADLNIGILFIMAFSSLGVYGILTAGWSSNNKFSLLGGLRAVAQLISYELAIGLSLVGVVMITGSFSLVDIVEAQSGVPFIVYQPLGFVLFFISALAETRRIPFDLPEAESTLVAGFHTEYSSMKFALFFLAEYIHITIISAMAVLIFFGGWRGPVLPSVVWFLVKVFLFVLVFVWVRGTLPRIRFDQLMDFGWKVLMPLSLLNILVTGYVAIIFL